jgi:hypothetical protein
MISIPAVRADRALAAARAPEQTIVTGSKAAIALAQAAYSRRAAPIWSRHNSGRPGHAISVRS